MSGVVVKQGAAKRGVPDEPEITHDGMEIAEGEAARLAWETPVRGQLSQSEKARLRTALLASCRQDTEAMVAVRRRLSW